ncbi:MAG: alcohol dehydrogenase catalytic domain-containing protein [Clostridia bacterium]|nr:alcohol dehydrogenase catalytic domain-containing protein [Clostridia bacterium]
MKALRKIKAGEGGVQLFNDMPIPEPAAGEVRIKIIYAALCGTDLHIRNDAFPVQMPVTIGHEYSGIIDAVGEGVSELAVGDRVVSMTAAGYCGHCDLCRAGLYMLCKEKKGMGSARDGAFAEYMTYPADRIFKIPEGVSMKAATISEPLACVVRAVLERTTINAGDYVYVSGPGVMGQFAAQLAKAAGAYVTVGGTNIDKERLALAKQICADDVVDIMDENAVEHAERVTGGHMYDVAFECSGSPRAIDTCIDILKKTGHFQQVALYGGKPVSVDLDKMLMKEITISNSYASERTSWQRLLNLMTAGKIQLEPYCSKILSLDEWEEAMEMFENKEGYKILFQINPDPDKN